MPIQVFIGGWGDPNRPQPPPGFSGRRMWPWLTWPWILGSGRYTTSSAIPSGRCVLLAQPLPSAFLGALEIGLDLIFGAFVFALLKCQ
jgi:hypothetical protein